MENARVYQVGNVSSVTTFEDAFGEYSNAGGRERRKKRKLERIEARREVKSARIGARSETKAARQEARQGRKLARKQRRTSIAGERLAKRQQRVSARAERRGTKVGARLQRRGLRTDLRGKRKAMRRGEPEGEMDEQTAAENGVIQPQEGYQEPQREDAQQQYQEEDNQEGYVGGYTEEPTDEAYEDEGNYEEEGSYEEQDNEEEGAAEGTDADLEGGDETGFDGSGMGSNVNPKLLDLANKIEWNDELIERLMDKADESFRLGRAVDNIEQVIDAREERISQLEGELEDWANADGLSPKQVDGRIRQVERARAMAKRNRINATKPKQGRRYHGGSETPVETELNPEFSPNRIVVPAEEKSPAIGLNGLDLIDDYDAPDTRTFELTSNASGITKNPINWGNVMLGIVLGGAVIYALKKYKVLDKI